ncbi:hypothetical protein ECG_00452 [Echinococcus granulosus]|uniref:Secreted protein n=1 Tax=Echinococcus granulosus TaxID=6210 RepID=A0A068X0Q4_ECHGR|nr:hypothetical protein ECG_00452 [Echinococcus granulosus]CDS23553.1 hypothetical protein EgrG_002042500 [Echinococcus granulosus]
MCVCACAKMIILTLPSPSPGQTPCHPRRGAFERPDNLAPIIAICAQAAEEGHVNGRGDALACGSFHYEFDRSQPIGGRSIPGRTAKEQQCVLADTLIGFTSVQLTSKAKAEAPALTL